MFPIITPVYVPHHDPEEDKITCPKCKHRFIPEDDGCSGTCMLPFAFFGLVLFISCVIGALSILGLVHPDDWINAAGVGEFAVGHRDSFELIFGLNILTFLLALPISFLLHIFVDK